MQMEDDVPPLSIWNNVIASTASGFFSRILFHPLDTAKSRIQASVTKETYNSTIGACIGTIKESGIRGLYRGLGVALVGGVPGTCLYLTGYEVGEKTTR